MAACAAALLIAPDARADVGTLTALVNFDTPMARTPVTGLIRASDGNFYGTTFYGGSSNDGTIFRLTPSGSFTTLINFTGTNGQYPAGGWVQASDGNFYGTTS